MKRLSPTIFLSLFLLWQWWLPFVQAERVQSTAQSEAFSLEAFGQIDQGGVSVAVSLSPACGVDCVRQRLIFTNHFSMDFARLTPPHRGHLAALSAHDVSIWPQAPPYLSVV